MDVQEWFVSEIEETARWRRDVDDRFPDDYRNLATANALDAFAAYVKSLDPDDRRLRTLEDLTSYAPGEFAFRCNGHASHDLSRLAHCGNPGPMGSVMASILRVAALDMVDDVREELDETAEPFGGGLLKEIARLTLSEEQIESDLGELLEEAANRGYSWTIISKVSGLSRQALSERYRSRPARSASRR